MSIILTSEEIRLIEYTKEAIVKYNKIRHANGGIDTLYSFLLLIFAGKKILDSVVGNKQSLKGIRALSLQRRRNMAHVTGKMMEKEYELWKASKDYINGEITIEQLEEIENSYNLERYQGCILTQDLQSDKYIFLMSFERSPQNCFTL